MDINLVLKDLEKIKLSDDVIDTIVDDFVSIMEKHGIAEKIPYDDDYEMFKNNPIWTLFITKVVSSISHQIEWNLICQSLIRGSK